MARLESDYVQPAGEANTAAGGTPFRLEDSIGGIWSGKPIFGQDQVIAQLDTGLEIGGKTITFGFLDGPHTIGQYNKPGAHSEPAGYAPLTDAQKDAVRASMVLWDDLIAPSVAEKNGNGADIMVANTTTTGPAAAWAYYPDPDQGTGHEVASDVWVVNPATLPPNGAVDPGQFGSYTLIHELGHAFGLSHPGPYDAAADTDGDGVPDPISYEYSAVYAQDTRQYTVMSYFEDDSSGGGQTWNVSTANTTMPQTPLIHDILAIQAKYGADPATRADDTVYFANSTAGNAVYDLARNPFPYLAVYDAGGNDTFDFSTANGGVFIDLRPGSFSSASQGYLPLDQANAAIEAQPGHPQGWWTADSYPGWVDFVTSQVEGRVEGDTGIAGITATSFDNVSIAYNTVIENAIGGAARDYLVGNDVANILKGNGGDDVLNGLAGDDQLWGGDGADEFRFSDHSGNDTIKDFVSGTDRINLADIDADTSTAGDQAFAFVGTAAFTGTAGELQLYTSHGEQYLAGDVDGNGVADFAIGIGAAWVIQGDLVL